MEDLEYSRLKPYFLTQETVGKATLAEIDQQGHSLTNGNCQKPFARSKETC